MTTPKDQMPKEIWAQPVIYLGEDYSEEVDAYPYPFDRGVRYLRADLVQAKDAEIAKLKQERDLLARGVLAEASTEGRSPTVRRDHQNTDHG